MCRARFCGLMAAIVVIAIAGAAPAQEYLPGGALQGVPLPLFPTQHGEKPGYPGVIPDLQVPQALAGGKQYIPFTSEGLPPECQLYDGAVEHFRAYWFKYVPVKSFFDRQSRIKNWLARDLVPNKAEDYAEPVYWVPRHADVRFTGQFNKPVKVVRARVNDPVFRLDCGTLDVGLYAIRVVGAVETDQLVRHRKPLILKLTVNDGLKGEESSYRFRCKYVDEFYAVAEFYFHAPERRAYRAAVTVDDGSLVELLVHNIDLHDALAGTVRRPIKTRATLNLPKAGAKPAANDEKRLALEANLWQVLPPLNAQAGHIYGMGGDDPKENWPNYGAGGLTPDQIKEQGGEWKVAPVGPVLLVNDKLMLQYTIADLAAGKPLPDPYPFKDNGTGVYTPAAKEGEKPQNWYPVANAVRDRRGAYVTDLTAKARQFRDKGDVEAGRTAAFMLCRAAYDYPAADNSNALGNLILQPGAYGRDLGCRRRDPSLGGGPGLVSQYDMLFDLIKSDPGLAQSLNRFIPWIKTPQDVVKLLDVYVVQTDAKRILRYQWLSDNEPTMILPSVIALGDNLVTDPWMDWLFTAAYIYPLPPSGLPDLLVTGNDRNGIGYIGSYAYALGEQCAPKAAEIEEYLAAGGNPKYDLRDPKRFPKPISACYWYLASRMAGLYFPRVGDVGGPDKYYGQWFEGNGAQWRLGWRWTKDPKFAYVIKNYGKRGSEIDAEWAEIEAAAAQLKRAPWLDSRSRVLSNWFGLLESGVAQDDIRFRRDVYLRVGLGYGHAHADTLDLEGHAHGYPFTIDGGQRGGYSTPGDAKTRVHNLVEVDAMDWRGHSWVNTLTDAEGARYLMAEATPPDNHSNVKLYRRQVALVDVDGGEAPEPPPAPPVGPGQPLAKAVTPNSYVFDVVRVAGGKVHTYCFHGPVEDELMTNARDVQQGLDNIKDEAEKAFLTKFPLPERASAGSAPAILEATWRMTREKMYGNEAGMNGAIWDAASPRKYTRLHILGHENDRVMTGALHCYYPVLNYRFTNLYVRRTAQEESEVVFPAIIEPYVGEPFIAERRLLRVADNETDARQAVAVEVKTKDGRTDICFADGRPDKIRDVAGLKVAAEYAFYSVDGQGFRQATLTGGTLLSGSDAVLKLARRERTGVVAKADYGEKSLTIDQAWPQAGLLTDRVFEIGVPGRMTSYTIAAANRDGNNTQFTVTEGADFYLSRVGTVDAANRRVLCVLAPPNIPKENPQPVPGQDKHWVASNEAGTKSWRADYVGQDPDTNWYIFQLDGAVTEADFARNGGFRLREYGVGDTVRQSTFASLRRVEPGVYELVADVAVTVSLRGAGFEISSDQKTTWKRLAPSSAGEWVTAEFSEDARGRGAVYLRLLRRQ